MAKVNKSEFDFCGIVFIGGGSSWVYASSPEDAATKAAKQCKRDWKSLFEFERQHEFKVCIYDMKEHNGWYADHRGVFDKETNKEIPLMRVDSVTV